MRKSTLFLSITTAAFAVSTLYLALELRSRDADVAHTVAGIEMPRGLTRDTVFGSDVEAPDRAQRHPETGSAAAAATAGTAGATTGTPASINAPSRRDGMEDTTAMFMRQQLARLDDPVQRVQLLNEARTGVRRQFGRLRDQLKLSDATFEQLVTLLAEQNLQSQEIYARCAVDPACKTDENFKLHPVDDRSQEMLALLGAEGVEALTKYQVSIGERDTVAQLRGRLNESSFMRDEQAEALVFALADERDRYQKETTARGSKLEGWGTTLGTIMYSADSNSIDQRLAEAAQYSQRLRQRAGAVLSPAQLAAFNQMQDELLAQMAAYLRPASTSHKQRV